MAKRKVVTSRVEVFRVKGENMKIAFNNFKQEKGLDDYHLKMLVEDFDQNRLSKGAILLKSKELHTKYANNKVSEYSIFGALYNHKPVIKDESRIIKHNVINKGTKKWVTVNRYVTDSGEILESDKGTKAEAMVRALELAMEHNKTINVILGKDLENGDGVLYIAEYIPTEHIDDTNIYIFWMYITEVKEVEEDELIEANTEVDEVGQLSIKDDLGTYIGRTILMD